MKVTIEHFNGIDTLENVNEAYAVGDKFEVHVVTEDEGIKKFYGAFISHIEQ